MSKIDSFLDGRVLKHVTLYRLIFLLVAFLIIAFIIDLASKPRYPKSLPRVGYGDNAIATLRNWIGYVIHFGQWCDEGYFQYSKNNKAFVVPSAASRPQEFVVPRSQTKWMLDLPESVLSAHEAQNDMLYSKYNFLGNQYADDVFHIRVVHKSLARHLSNIIPEIEDEVANAIDSALGKDSSEWKTVNLWETLLHIVPQVTNRVLVGSSTCRNRDFLEAMVHFADSVVINSLILNMFPRILHPVVGKLVAIPNYRHWLKAHQIVRPVVQDRLMKILHKETAGLPEDFLTWAIRLAHSEGRFDELNPESISKRLLPIEFAAIHTTVITAHYLMIDLLTSHESLGYIQSIKEETSRVHEEEGSKWTKAGLNRLVRTDSAIRESMRVSNFATSLTKRKVVAKEGITSPEGWHLPYGGLLMLNLASIHHDADLYDSPKEYDAFRFSRLREQHGSQSQDQRNANDDLSSKKMGMSTTSDTHLPFGHGRHACPGRFFAAHELKMILAYMFQNYEIKPMKHRPKEQWIGQTIIPALDVKIEIKRLRAMD